MKYDNRETGRVINSSVLDRKSKWVIPGQAKLFGTGREARHKSVGKEGGRVVRGMGWALRVMRWALWGEGGCRRAWRRRGPAGRGLRSCRPVRREVLLPAEPVPVLVGLT